MMSSNIAAVIGEKPLNRIEVISTHEVGSTFTFYVSDKLTEMNISGNNVNHNILQDKEYSDVIIFEERFDSSIHNHQV